jgi:uncharacterized protein (DUF433 family)
MGWGYLLMPTDSARREHSLHLVIGFWRLGVLDGESAVSAALELFPQTDLSQFVTVTAGQIDPCFAGTEVRLDAVVQAAVEGCSLQSMQVYWKFLSAEHLVAALVVVARCWPHDQLPVGIRPVQWPLR